MRTLGYLFSILIISFAFYGVTQFVLNCRNSFKAKVSELKAQKYGKVVNVKDYESEEDTE